MKAKNQTAGPSIELEAVVRKRNQITLPGQAVELLDIREGDVLVIQVMRGSAVLRPVRRSYAGMAKGVYGLADDFVARERADWE
jgi:bifunctional DNA-binding transcriptional regulator/antitoxin component of YhaV-PrlF toxin-antitoxin module